MSGAPEGSTGSGSGLKHPRDMPQLKIYLTDWWKGGLNSGPLGTRPLIFFLFNIYFIAKNYSNGVGLPVLTSLVTTLTSPVTCWLLY